MLDVKVILGRNIKALRNELGLNQEIFSEKILIAPATLSLLELGKRFTTSETINNICNNFNIHPVELFIIEPRRIHTDFTNRNETINDINILLNALDTSKLKFITEIIKNLSDDNLDLKYKYYGVKSIT